MEDAPQLEEATFEIEDDVQQAKLFARKTLFFRLFYWTIPVLLQLTGKLKNGNQYRAHGAVCVYLVLAQHASIGPRRVRLKRKTIGQMAGISVGHVWRSIEVLKEAGLVTCFGQELGGCCLFELPSEPPEGARIARAPRQIDGRASYARPNSVRARTLCAPPLPDTTNTLFREEEEERRAPAAAALRSIEELSEKQVASALACATTTERVVLAAKMEVGYRPGPTEKDKKIGLLYSLILDPSNIGRRFLLAAEHKRTRGTAAATNPAPAAPRPTDEEIKAGIALMKAGLKGGAQ